MVKTTLKPTSRYIPSDDIELHVLDWGGDGPPLITIHGGRRTANSWNAVARRLHHGFRVISVDIRGHGNSGCLLYTSPSPRDGLLSRMPSSA